MRSLQFASENELFRKCRNTSKRKSEYRFLNLTSNNTRRLRLGHRCAPHHAVRSARTSLPQSPARPHFDRETEEFIHAPVTRKTPERLSLDHQAVSPLETPAERTKKRVPLRKRSAGVLVSTTCSRNTGRRDFNLHVPCSTAREIWNVPEVPIKPCQLQDLKQKK